RVGDALGTTAQARQCGAARRPFGFVRRSADLRPAGGGGGERPPRGGPRPGGRPRGGRGCPLHAPGGRHPQGAPRNRTVTVPSGSWVVRSMRWKTTREPSAPVPTTLKGPPAVNCSPGGLLCSLKVVV